MVSFTLHFQLHPIKSLKFCEIVSFDNFLIHILDLNNMSLKDNLLTIPKCKQLASITKTPRVISC